MLENRKRNILIILLLVLLAMLVVSGALPGVELQPSTPFPGADGENDSRVPLIFKSVVNSDGLANAIVSGILGLAILVFLFYFLVNFLLHSDIRRFLRNMLLLILLISLVLIFPKTSIKQPVSESGDAAHSTLASPGTYTVAPIGEPPETFIWIILIILIAAVLLLSLWLVFRRRNAAPHPDKILRQAQAAVDSLQKGEAFQSVILRCYMEMTRVLQEEQGIERETNLTAREFMEYLQKRGISPSPIHDLTLLFESARYGPLPPSEKDEQLGLASLHEIIQDLQRRAQ
jgi:hypothetical protein